MKRNILLNPGPATTTLTVKQALMVPDICPREQEFGQMVKQVAIDLTNFVANSEEYATVLFGGSGTAAVEAVLSSCGGPKNGVVVIDNGAYGKRMCQILDAYGIPFARYESSKFEPIDIQELERYMNNCIGQGENFTHLAMIHSETTTGILNEIQAVGELANRYHLSFVVDAMSSYGAIPIDMKAMNIDYLISSANKNLQGMAGVSFVVANKEKLEALANKKRINFYLNLYDQYDHFKQTGQFRFTPPVQVIYALKQAIEELKEETIKGRYQRYSNNWRTLLKGMSELGFTYMVAKENQSRIITTFKEPEWEKFSFESMHDFCYEKGYTIYPGKVGEIGTFRIANIGDLNEEDIKGFLEVLSQYCSVIGH